MNKQLDESLCRDFPNLYADREADMSATCMCWGFECGSGWEPLIRRCSEKLEELIVQWKRENPGAEYPPKASQVKEKFGTLRFYMTSYTKAMYEAIRQAEAESEFTCEECGAIDGKLNNRGWISCLCDRCRGGSTHGGVDDDSEG